MRRVIFSPCYLGGEYFDRTVKWLKFYKPLLRPWLGVDKIILVDNGSPSGLIEKLGKESFFEIERFYSHIPKEGSDYSFWWRSYFFGHEIAFDRGFESVIHIDTDMFVLSRRLCEYLKAPGSAYDALWCPKRQWAESALTAMSFHFWPVFRRWYCDQPLGFEKETAESILPFVRVVKDFNGDRYGEDNVPQNSLMDYYGQAQTQTKLVFKDPLHHHLIVSRLNRP